MIHTLLAWAFSPQGNVVILAVLAFLVVPTVGWKWFRDAVEPLDHDPRRHRRG